jgi:hypothetical protein
MVGDGAELFVSHAGADRAWAGWVAWQLTAASYTAELDVWDWAAGGNFATAMNDALDRRDPVAVHATLSIPRELHDQMASAPAAFTGHYWQEA